MPRPNKYTVDYFSHDSNASEGKTLTILFNHFEHEGISCWWQLLERVSSTNNHVISIRNSEELEYLSAKLHFSPERLREILDKMASLNAIDSILYEHGVIWIQNLVDRLEPVYKTRKQSLPSKPKLIKQENGFIVEETELILPESTQTKGTKLKETKERNNGTGNIFELFEDNFQKITKTNADIINDFIDEYGEEKVLYSLNEAIKYNKRNLKYVEGILKGNGKNKRDSKIPKEYTEYSDPELDATPLD